MWHKHFGHHHIGALKLMQKNSIVSDMFIISGGEEVYTTCQYSKMHMTNFLIGGVFCATRKIKQINSDVCGSMSFTSLSYNKYFILIIDDFTRMT